MKILRTDFGLKYIIAEVEGQEITVSFRSNWRRGIYDVSIRINGNDCPTKIKSTYPGLVRRIREALLLIRLALKNAINRISERSS